MESMLSESVCSVSVRMRGKEEDGRVYSLS